MTAPITTKPETITGLYRRHLREMRSYADQIEQVLGRDSPIVQRIRSCATSNEFALDRVIERYKQDGPNYDWAFREA